MDTGNFNRVKMKKLYILCLAVGFIYFETQYLCTQVSGIISGHWSIVK